MLQKRRLRHREGRNKFLQTSNPAPPSLRPLIPRWLSILLAPPFSGPPPWVSATLPPPALPSQVGRALAVYMARHPLWCHRQAPISEFWGRGSSPRECSAPQVMPCFVFTGFLPKWLAFPLVASDCCRHRPRRLPLGQGSEDLAGSPGSWLDSSVAVHPDGPTPLVLALGHPQDVCFCAVLPWGGQGTRNFHDTFPSLRPEGHSHL